MIDQSLARPAPTTTETTRLECGAELYREHFERFSYAGGGVFVVPSGSDLALAYEVTLREGVERCECADHAHRAGRCKHIIGARIFKARTGTCAGCGERHRFRDMHEVGDDHLTFFEGDELCRRCAAAAGVL